VTAGGAPRSPRRRLPGYLGPAAWSATASLALCGWAVTAGALRRQLALTARARHEVRGPLCTAQLALGGLERSARVEAIDLELRRAALALEDLSGARHAAVWRQGPVDVHALILECAPGWHSLAACHGATVSVDGTPAFVVGDALRLAQACANLVANALEHGGGGTVCVRSFAADGRVRIEVADAGRGLPAPLPALLTAARGRRSPRGHGLAIAAAIAERHGGRLTAAPSPVGARLVVDLPQASQRRSRLAAPRRSLARAS
jgi:signal transduction histidine kinase